MGVGHDYTGVNAKASPPTILSFMQRGQCLQTPAERRVHRRFVSAHRLVAGDDAFGQGVRVEVRAQERHSVGEVAHVYADERALFCPGQLFLTALHGSTSLAPRDQVSEPSRRSHISRTGCPFRI
jgi:hypothetical protein